MQDGENQNCCQMSEHISKLKHEQAIFIDSLLLSSSNTDQVAFAKEHLDHIAGVEYVLGQKSGKNDVVYYVPVMKTLFSLLKHSDVLAEVINGHRSNTPGLLGDYCDGSLFANSELFSNDVCSLQVQLYVDDFETVNPLGTYTKNTSSVLATLSLETYHQGKDQN